jgi:tetratricopeptide (TPR) repeat protein
VTLSSPAHLDEILSHLREQWHALVKTDNLLGPRFALAGVLNQLVVVEALLPALRDTSRLETLRLGALYAESAAWLYEDSGQLAQARNWTGRAMEWAYEADDQIMLAWTVFRRSQQAGASGDAAQVIGLARAARRDEERLPSPMRAAIRVQQAHGHALDGRERASQQLLDEAHEWAANDTVGDARGGHGSYCTPSYIEIHRAGCWLTMGQPKTAIAVYERTVPSLPAVYQRDRAAALSRMAVAYAADGRLEEAAGAARAALPVARGAGSSRIVGEISSLSATLERHRPLPAIAALAEELESGAA